MANNLPALRIGYQYLDPGPPPRSDLLNTPPAVGSHPDLMTSYRRWRQRVEADEAVLAQAHARQVAWFPVLKSGRHRVLPVLGGTPIGWDSLVASLVTAGIDSGFDAIMVVSATQWPILESLRDIAARARRASVRLDRVSSRGSTVDLFNARGAQELAGYLADSLRVIPGPQGRRDSAREKADLLAIADLIDPPVTLVRLTSGIDVALGSMVPGQSGLSRTEEQKLRDFHHNVIAQRRQTADRLDGLHADLRQLCGFSRDPSTNPIELGSGKAKVRVLEVDPAEGVHEFEVGRALVATAVARAFARPAQHPEMLIIGGAETFSDEILDSLRGSAQHAGKQLVLLFAEVTSAAQRALGSGGSDLAGFMRLPNADDAEVAARHFGREFSFVVDGVSIAEGRTEEWNRSETLGRTQSTTRTTNFGRAFGHSVARSFGSSDSVSTGIGGSTSRVLTQSASRVHDYVIEPEVFQQLDELALLFAEGKTAILLNCDYRLRQHQQASSAPIQGP